MSDDDFFSDGEKNKLGGLMPIVEVPSDATSTVDGDTPRSEAPETTYRSDKEDSEEYLSDEKDEEETPRNSSRSSRKRHKHKTKNGKNSIDMTPPNKLLSRAEKKARRYTKDKKIDKAIKELIRCSALTRIVYGDGHWKLAEAYVNLAQGYLDQKAYASQAHYHSENAKTIMMNGIQTSSSSTDKANIMEVLVNIYYILGRSLTALKKFPEAEQSLLKSEKISTGRSKLPSVTDDNLDKWDVKIYIAIAKLSGKQQKFAMATTYFDKALDLLERMYGEDSPELIPVYQGLGLVEQSKGKHADQEKAIEHFLQAHSIASAHHKGGDVEVAETARALATAYSNVGVEDAENSAESYLNECLAIYQAVHGPNHNKTLDIQDELAKIMVRTKREEEAISMLKSTIEPKKEVYGEFSAEVADTWKLIGSVYLSNGEPEKALRALKKCHNVECTLYGTNNKKSKDTQRTLDLLMANPLVASKQKKTKADELKERPRFNHIMKRDTPLGGFKSQ